MGRNFKYKDFVNKLRFQVGGVCPEEFSEYGEKKIKSSVYSHALKAAMALYKENSVSVEECEIITQIIAEWTFHKKIDLMNGEIPEVFHDRVLNKINQAIYEYLIDECKCGGLTYSDIEANGTSDAVSVVEDIVKDTYRDELSRIYSDRGISKDDYTWALKQSHIDDVVDEIDEKDGVKEDKFSSHFYPITFKDIFKRDKFLFCAYFVSIIINLFALINSAKSDSQLVFIFLSFVILLITGLCRRIIITFSKIALNNTQYIEEELEDLQLAVNPNFMYERLGVDVISMQVGAGLVPLCDPTGRNKLMPAVAKLRKTLTDELGYIIPNIRAMDSKTLDFYECKIFIRGAQRDAFVVDPKKENSQDIIVEHLRKCCIKHVNDILSKTDVLKLMELTRSQDPTLINDLIPELISAIDFRRIVVNLLREEVPIKDIILIFERLCDFARFNSQPYVLSERLRAEMGATICTKYSQEVNNELILYAYTFTDECEKMLEDAAQHTELGIMLMLDSNTIEALVEAVGKAVNENNQAVLLVSPKIRLPLYGLLSRYLDDIRILSFAELISEISVKELGQISF